MKKQGGKAVTSGTRKAPNVPASKVAQAKGATVSSLSGMVNQYGGNLVSALQAGGQPAMEAFLAAFFGPGVPVPAVIPREQAQGQGLPRRLNYVPSINLWVQPQRDSGYDFQQLRDLSRQWDVLRLVEETCKDVISTMNYKFRLKAAQAAPKRGENKRIDALDDFFRKPDRIHSRSKWIRQILGDRYEIDAVAIAPRMTLGGEVYALRLLDGGTIQVFLDKFGDIPEMDPDAPAFRQVIQGVPAYTFNWGELLYFMSNPSTDRVYGYSNVEQLGLTINIAVRRELTKLGYYTKGNMPEVLIPTNPSWNPDQIAQWNQDWAVLFEDNALKRFTGHWVPGGGGTPFQMKEPPLKTEFDDALIQKVCFAFSISSQPFMRMMNRATAKTAEEGAKEQGIVTVSNEIAAIITECVERWWGYDDIECFVQQNPSIDPKVQADIDASDIEHGVISPDAVRSRKGYETDGKEIVFVSTAQPLSRVYEEPEPVPAPLAAFAAPEPRDSAKGQQPGKKGEKEQAPKDEGSASDEGGKPSEAPSKEGAAKEGTSGSRSFRKGQKVLRPPSRDRKAFRVATTGITKALRAFFGKIRPKVTKQIAEAVDAIPEGTLAALVKEALRKDDLTITVQDILDRLDLTEFEELYPAIAAQLKALAFEGATAAAVQLGLDAEAALGERLGERAVVWAEARAAELVGKKLVGGELVDNPSARWRIDEGTREFLRETIARSVEEGWSPQRLAEAIENGTAFSDYRAMMIARTEAARADIAASRIAWNESDLVWGTEWLLGPEPCEECVENSEDGPDGDGRLELGESYEHGDPPVHPHCECALCAVLREEEEVA